LKRVKSDRKFKKKADNKDEKMNHAAGRERLILGLKTLGVCPGNILFIHSSFKNLGPVEGGAGTLISALEDAVGPDGLLLMPSFNLVAGELRAATWNIETTPSTVGYLTEYFRTIPGTVRSDHYSHSVAARGQRAAEFVAGHRSQEGPVSPWDALPWGKAFGTQTPLWKAYEAGGKVLMLGVDYYSSTYVHLVETLWWNRRLQNNPAAEFIALDRNKLGVYWDAQGYLSRGKVGRADCRLFSIRDYVDMLLKVVEDNPQPWTVNPVIFKIAGQEPDPRRYRACRRMLVGPWCNQPEEYEGYNGFVGWMGMTILRSGRWLLTFSSGYWHASPPLTPEILENPEFRKQFDEYHAIGCPYVTAPRGGRAEIMYSDDQGKTWSKPAPLVDTEMDDRHPTILELDDGTLLCTFFGFAFGPAYHALYILSHDGGKTWTSPIPLPVKAGGFGAGPAIQLSDGTVVWVTKGKLDSSPEYYVTEVFRSTDQGKTFELTSVVRAPDHHLIEPTIAQLPDKRLVMICRPQGDICWSTDGGRSWNEPVAFGMDLFDPHLLMLPNGVLACFHGSFLDHTLRVILSRDNGKTWHGPANALGYSIDPSIYGYSHPVLLPDGSVYVVYLQSCGLFPADARTEALWGIRIKIPDTADGIEILPAPGSPAEQGLILTGQEPNATSSRNQEIDKMF
jgi:aminoglycoside N3'-acetyltransferase